MSATKSTIARPSDEVMQDLYITQGLGCPEIGRMYQRDPTPLPSIDAPFLDAEIVIARIKRGAEAAEREMSMPTLFDMDQEAA